jgi:hypothetical protein
MKVIWWQDSKLYTPSGKFNVHKENRLGKNEI